MQLGNQKVNNQNKIKEQNKKEDNTKKDQKENSKNESEISTYINYKNQPNNSVQKFIVSKNNILE